MIYYHTDVFSAKILSGNGLTVIYHEDVMDIQSMQKIAQEFKQVETIFLMQIGEKRFRARIFTVEEELDFAGHPILGAMATVHEKLYAGENSLTAVFELNRKTLQLETIKIDDYFRATMNQGIPEFLGTVEGEKGTIILQALNLTTDNLHPTLPMEVISTGLSYLIVPLSSGLAQARISVNNFEELLSEVNAKFVYVFDVAKMEGRTWDNLGAVEDVATGSAAGPTGAYLFKRGVYKATETIEINQGGFVKRPSKITVFSDPSTGEMKVSGDVKIVAKGQLYM
ncbi:MAG: PhzF family phenazine biosynthesis protein [Lawsonibacter sp.]|nr:PhzF family phenazine biosynthesis protein [Lawsonibacter sp.]